MSDATRACTREGGKVRVGDRLLFVGTVTSALEGSEQICVRFDDLDGSYLRLFASDAIGPAPPEPIKVGDTVSLFGDAGRGTVLHVDGNLAWVRISPTQNAIYSLRHMIRVPS